MLVVFILVLATSICARGETRLLLARVVGNCGGVTGQLAWEGNVSEHLKNHSKMQLSRQTSCTILITMFDTVFGAPTCL